VARGATALSPRVAGVKNALIIAEMLVPATASIIIPPCRSISPGCLTTDDPALLQQMLRDVVAAAAHRHGELHAENDKVRMLIQRLLRHRFGRRSGRLGDDQLQFGLEDLEQTIAENQAGQDAADAATGKRRGRDTRPNRNHGALAAHLPGDEAVIDIEDHDSPYCGSSLQPIGELRTGQLDIAPAQ
jgi:transposase